MPKGRGFERRGTSVRIHFDGPARQQKGRTDVSTAEHAETNRRDFLYIATGSVAAVGAALGHLIGSTAWPLALAMAAAGCLALLLWATTRGVRVYR